MSKTRIAFYGGGHLGRQVYHHLAHYYHDTVELIGFLDDTQEKGREVIDDKLTLGSLDNATNAIGLRPDSVDIVFAIGYSSMLARRAALERVLGAGYRLFTVVHPRATIEPGANVGAGSIVLAGAIIDQNVTVGAACFIDIGVRLTAGTTVGCNNYFSSGTSTGSRVKIGDDCFFGMDCTITTDVEMGSNLFVNAKTLVPRNVGNNVKLVQVHKSRELPISNP